MFWAMSWAAADCGIAPASMAAARVVFAQQPKVMARLPGSLVHMRADLACELEQALLNDNRHLAGERKRLLTLGKDPHVPIILVLGRSQLRPRFLVARRPLLELPQLSALPFDLARPRFLTPLEALDAVHHGDAVIIDRAEQAGE